MVILGTGIGREDRKEWSDNQENQERVGMRMSWERYSRERNS